MSSIIDDMRDWCRGRSWLWRLPVLLFLAYTGVRQYQDPMSFTYFAAINLCIHEGGHVLMRPFGEGLIHTAGGTLAQIAAPIISMFILGRQRDYFGISVCLGWLSTNLVEIGVYMADARAMALPLVTAEGAGMSADDIDVFKAHDWHNMFGRFGLLDYDERIGLATRDVAAVVMAGALLFGAWLLMEMATPERKKEPARY